jgi:general secretion pathway protein C
MWTATSAAWTVRGATFALWALAAASAAWSGLQLGGGGRERAVPLAAARSVPPADPAAIARLLGSTPAAAAVAAVGAPQPALASRFQLVGVVAESRSGRGAALIAVDGRPARPFRVGSAIEEGVVLQSVQGRQAVLSARGNGPITLELPPLQGAGQPAQTPIAAPR